MSDKGTQFVNAIVGELFIAVGIDHKLSMAYSKEENAIVERSNKEILRHLNAILFDKNVVDNWFEYLPLVQRIMNATTHSSIGVSPASLLFGNSTQLDRGIFLSTQESSITDSTQQSPQKLSEWVKNMLEHQHTLIKVAQQYQTEKDAKHIINTTPDSVTTFPINSYVLVRYNKIAFGRKILEII